MVRKRRHAFLRAIVLSALLSANSMVVLADGIQQQSDADTLNESLETGDQTYSDSYSYHYAAAPIHDSIGQVFGQTGPITIGNANTAGHSLTLKADLSSEAGHDRAGNILSDIPGMETTVTNLQSLNLDLSGARARGSDITPMWPGNILVDNDGIVTIDDTVKTLNATLTRTVPQGGRDYNILAQDGMINILSPTVNLVTEGGLNSVSLALDSSGRDNLQAHINLGDGAHKLDSVTIDHRTRPDDWVNSPAVPSTGPIEHWGILVRTKSNATLESGTWINAKRLEIKNMTTGIGVTGSNVNTPTAHFRLNSSDDKADTVHIQASEVGIVSSNGGRNEIYGKRIDIETGSPQPNLRVPATRGIESMNGGRVTIGTESGASEGLFLHGAGVEATRGLISWGAPNSLVEVVSGNVDLDRYEQAVWTGNSRSRGDDGKVHLGSDASPINDVAIHNSNEGLRAAPNGTIEVNSHNLDIHDNVRTPVWLDGSGTVDVHTSGTATLRGTSGNAINSAGHLTINTGDDDGATNITGTVLTHVDRAATTDISFHTADSRFYGNAFGERGTTTITVSNGANWTLNPTVARSRVNTTIDTLHHSNNGVVNLGGNGTWCSWLTY